MSRTQFKSASPSKNTRIVYKNAKEDDTTNDMRSLYTATIGKSGMNKTTQGFPKVSLADIGAMQRTCSSRGSVSSSKLGLTTPTKNIRKSSDVVKKNIFEATNSTPQTTKNATSSRQVESPEQSAAAAQEAHQCFSESQMMKETMKQQFGNNPHVNIDNEAEYYEAVKRLDTCGKCWAAQQKFYSTPFKIKHKMPGQSLYQKDFVKHPLNDQGPALKNDFYTTFKNTEPMDFTTTNKNDFKAWNVGPVKKETMNWKPATSGIPFAGKSQYKSEYANWGANKMAYEKASQALTVIPALPFLSATTYKDNFHMPEATQQLKPKDRDLWNKNKKTPITCALPFQGESTHAATYKPFKVSQAPNFEEKEEYSPTECLPEHHRSLYARDFAAKAQYVCPAVTFMETNPHPKLKHLNA